MKKRVLAVLLVLCVLLSGCATSKDTPAKKNGYFAWMDSYYATDKDTSVGISLTYMYKTKPDFKISEVVAIDFGSISNDVIVTQFSLEKNSYTEVNLRNYGISLDFEFPTQGIYKTQEVTILLTNGTRLTYPIGNWVFDVDTPEPENPSVFTWESPTVSSNGAQLSYSYKPLVDGAKIVRLWYGDTFVLENTDGLPWEGIIELNQPGSPIRYVKTKMEVLLPSGKSEYVYGKGCYCGAMGLSKDVFESSKQYAQSFS